MQCPLSPRLIRFTNFRVLVCRGLIISSQACCNFSAALSSTSRRSSGRSRRSSRPARPAARLRTPSCSSTAKTCRPSKTVEDWKVQDGCAIADKHDIDTKQAFGDCQLHVEWADRRSRRQRPGTRQQRRFPDGQVRNPGPRLLRQQNLLRRPVRRGLQATALVNACRKPGEWQTYDISATPPGSISKAKSLKPACVTVLQNGVLVQTHLELAGATSYTEKPHYTAHPALACLLSPAVPRRSGPLPQHLGPRDQGHRRHAGPASAPSRTN